MMPNQSKLRFSWFEVLRAKKFWILGVTSCLVFVGAYLFWAWQFERRALWSVKINATYPSQVETAPEPVVSWSAQRDEVWLVIDQSLPLFFNRGFLPVEVKQIAYPQDENQFGFYAHYFSISGGDVQMVALTDRGSSVELSDVKTFGDPYGPSIFSSNTDLKNFLENELDKKFSRAKPEK
jgi:hypothetical protein